MQAEVERQLEEAERKAQGRAAAQAAALAATQALVAGQLEAADQKLEGKLAEADQKLTEGLVGWLLRGMSKGEEGRGEEGGTRMRDAEEQVGTQEGVTGGGGDREGWEGGAAGMKKNQEAEHGRGGAGR